MFGIINLTGKFWHNSGRLLPGLLGKALVLALIWQFLPYWIFILASLYLYFKSGSRALDLFLAYILLLAASVAVKLWLGFANIGKILIEFNSQVQYSLALTLFVAWFLLFGIKELVFLRRKEMLVLLQTLIFFILAFLFLWLISPGDFYPAIFIFSTVTMLLFAQFYNFVSQKSFGYALFLAITSSLVVLEIAWVASLLPVGIFGATTILVLFWFFAQRMYLLYEEKLLEAKVLLKNGLLFAALLVLVLVFS
ncbi:MAG: hypothetical protein HYT12_02230 [Candidatus Liptonbacteria bacterium]|nr:hypothetical protein [Candidatus Liptonbacteria bacterium]